MIFVKNLVLHATFLMGFSMFHTTKFLFLVATFYKEILHLHLEKFQRPWASINRNVISWIFAKTTEENLTLPCPYVPKIDLDSKSIAKWRQYMPSACFKLSCVCEGMILMCNLVVCNECLDSWKVNVRTSKRKSNILNTELCYCRVWVESI